MDGNRVPKIATRNRKPAAHLRLACIGSVRDHEKPEAMMEQPLFMRRSAMALGPRIFTKVFGLAETFGVCQIMFERPIVRKLQRVPGQCLECPLTLFEHFIRALRTEKRRERGAKLFMSARRCKERLPHFCGLLVHKVREPR